MERAIDCGCSWKDLIYLYHCFAFSLRIVWQQQKPQLWCSSPSINLVVFVDIDLEDPKTEEAATKIQAVFRGHQTRNKMKPSDNPEPAQNLEEEFSADDKGKGRLVSKIFFPFLENM